MNNALQRVTIQYSELEDRVQLAGELADGDVIVVWLTRRLLQRLIPVMVQWFEQRGDDALRADLIQGFAQQAARSELPQQPPVQVPTGRGGWLARTVNVTPQPSTLILELVGLDGQKAHLAMAAQPLRHWFNIMHDTVLKAGWPLDGWPAWICDAAATSAPSAPLH